MPPGPRSLQSVLDSAVRLDELGLSRVVEQAAELVHKAQSGQVLGTLSPRTIELLGDGSVTLALGAATETPGYIAPERLEGKPGDRRSDVYSLGVVLWEALANARLFEGSDEAMKAMALAGAVGPPSEMNANIPAELDAICKKALARDPADRHPSAKVFAAELGAVLEDAGYPEENDRIASFLAANPAVTGRAHDRAATPLPAPAVAPIAPPPPVAATPVAPSPAPAVVPAVDAQAAKVAELKSSRSAMNKTMLGMPMKFDSPAVPAAAPPPTMAAAMPKAPVVPVAGRAPTPEPTVGRTATTMGMTPQTIPQTPSGTSMGMSAQAIAAEKPARPKTPAGGVAPPPSAIPSIARTKSASVQPLKKEEVSSTAPGLTPTLRPPATPEVKPEPAAEPEKSDAQARTTAMGSSSLAEALAKLNAVAPADAEVPAAVAKVMRAESQPPVDLATTTVDTGPPEMPAPLVAATTKAAPPPPAPPELTATTRTAAEPHKVDPKLAAAETAPVRKLNVGAIPGATNEPVESISASVGGAMPAAGALPAADDDFAPEPDRPLPGATATAADPAAVVALPRRRRSTSKGDELGAWEWKSGSHEALPDDYEDDSQQAKKKRIMIIGGAVGVVVLLGLVFAIAGGGSDDKKNEKKQTASNTWKDEPVKQAVVETPVVAPAIDAAIVEPAVVAVDAAEPDAALPDAAVAVVIDAAVPDAAVEVVAKVEPVMPEPAKPEPVKTEPVKAIVKPEKTEPTKPEKTKPAKPKVEKTKPDKTKPGKPVDPYAPERSDPGVAYRQGLQQFARGDTSGALQTFKASAAMNPDHAPTWRGMGMAYEKLGNAKAAKSAYAKYLKLSPNASDAEKIRARMEKL